MNLPNIAFMLVASLPCAAATACELRLEGTWKSDGPATMSFVRSKARLGQPADELLQSITGHMRLTFRHGEVQTTMPELELSLSGKTQKFVGFDERRPYKVLFCNDETIVWSAKRLFSDGDDATTYHFVDADTVWVYGGSNDPKVPDLHIREFFRRVR